jgi:hypothetical protein
MANLEFALGCGRGWPPDWYDGAMNGRAVRHSLF